MYKNHSKLWIFIRMRKINYLVIIKKDGTFNKQLSFLAQGKMAKIAIRDLQN